jgi:hypothetical protein
MTTIIQISIFTIWTILVGCNGHSNRTKNSLFEKDTARIRSRPTESLDTPRSFVKNYGVNDTNKLFVFVGLYKQIQKQLADCDVEIEKMLQQMISSDEKKKNLRTDAKPHKKINKNAPKNFDLNQFAYQYFNGIDMMSIEGVSHSTVIALMSEVGSEGIKKLKRQSSLPHG